MLTLCLLNLLVFASCRQPPLAADSNRSLAANNSQATAVTLQGENDQPYVSQDGRWMVFVSRNRFDHNNSQVYLKDFSHGTESRLTFQNGDTSSPIFINAPDEVIYASTTDELKENPTFLLAKLPPKSEPAIKPPAELTAPSEIYWHNFKTPQMNRLTQFSGFDGNLRLGAKGEIFWTRWNNQQPQVLKASLHTPLQEKPVPLPAGALLATPAPGSPRKMIYLTSADSLKSSQLWLLENEKSSELAAEIKGLKFNPQWSPDNQWIFFVVKTSESGPRAIYAQKPDGTCLTKLTSADEDEKDPFAITEGPTLFFSRKVKGRWQIMKRPWTGPCPTPSKSIQ